VSVVEQLELGLDVEEWVPVHREPWSDRYDVSSLGRVRNRKTGRIISRWVHESHSRRYLRVTLMVGGAKWGPRVHRLVLEGFLGRRPSGHGAAHWNGDTMDNRAKNLRWATPMENAADQLRHDTRYKAGNDGVALAKQMRKRGATFKQIAERLGVSTSTAMNYVRGSWYQRRNAAQPTGDV
jgi:hypothetical protein